MLALSAARATMYAGEMDEGHDFEVADEDAELAAIEDGCTEIVRPVAPPPLAPPGADWKDLPAAPAPPPEYPKLMRHPGYPNGAATGLLVKDFRGKDANQVIWKFDSALEARITDNLKQAAIEEGQWTEKRDMSGGVGIAVIRERLNRGRQRVANARRAQLAALAANTPPTSGN